jgi:hypothetical protein
MALGNLWEFEWEMMARYDFDEFGWTWTSQTLEEGHSQ